MGIIKRLSASLGITESEAINILEDDGHRFLECVDPMTGTIEYMEIDDE